MIKITLFTLFAMYILSRGQTDGIIDVTNVEKIECNDGSCVNATITITNPANEFVLECNGGRLGCMGASIEIIVTECMDIKWIKCGSEGGCRGATIKITNEVDGTCVVTIRHIDCEGLYACADASFIFVGDVNVNECRCGENGCTGASGIEETEGVSNHDIMVTLDFSTLETIWAIVIVCVIFYVTLFWCYYHTKSKTQRLVDHDSLP